MTDWLVQAFVATLLLTSSVFALRRPVSRIFGARAAYALWALPALRMVIPPLPEWRGLYLPFWRFESHRITIGLVSPEDTHRLTGPLPAVVRTAALNTPGANLLGPSWTTLAVIIWIAGATIWFGWQMLRYHGFIRFARRSATIFSRVRSIDVVLTDHVDGPVAVGVIRRQIFLPRQFLSRYAPQERRLAILHELAHHDRNDIRANLIALIVLSLHWWNPIAHLAYRLFRADQELACDATVLGRIDTANRYAYGSAILKSAVARVPKVSCALSHKQALKRRLQAMAGDPIPSRRHHFGLVMVVMMTAAGLAGTASGRLSVPSEVMISRLMIAAPIELTGSSRPTSRKARHATLRFDFAKTSTL